MKKIIFFSLVLLIVVNVSTTERFQSGIHFDNTIVVGFSAEAINTRTGNISIQRNTRGMVQIGVPSFDEIASEYSFTELERMYWVEDKDWHDENGIYPMNIFRVKLSDNSRIDNALEALMQDSNVIFAEFEGINQLHSIPTDPEIENQWHLEKILAPELWKYFQGNENIIIAITDSGVKWNHIDLKDNIYIRESELEGREINWDRGIIEGLPGGGSAGEYPGNSVYGDVIGWNFYTTPQSNNSYQDYVGNIHGTHVAGIAAAVGGNNIMGSGVAPIAKILVSRHSSNTSYDPYMRNPYAGIYYSADRGAHVINASWGNEQGGNSNQANTAVNYAQSQGAVVVAAAGNMPLGNVQPGSGNYPASAVNVISVANLNPQDRKSPSSNYGTHLTIAAPGQGIYSTTYFGTGATAIDAMEHLSGTSMASPVVAGVVGMVMALNPDLTPAEVRQRIVSTADPLPDEPLFHEGLMGAGRVNAFRAVMSGHLPRLSVSEEMIVTEYEGDGDGVPNIGETISVKILLDNEAGWATALETTATLSTDFPGVTIHQNILEYDSEIESGSYGTPVNAAIFSVDEAIGTLEIPFKLVVKSNQSAKNPFPYTVELETIVKISMSKQNWPLVLNAESPASPMVTDLDGTGRKLVTYAAGILHVVDTQKNYSPGFPLNIGEAIPGEFAIGDVARNGNQQIVMVTLNGKLLVISHTGEILNEYDFGAQVRSSPIIADLNNDGYYEIIAATQNGLLYVFNGNDLSLWSNFPITLGSNIMVNMAVGDVNGDEIQDIVLNYTAADSQGVIVINPITAENITGFPYVGFGSTVAGASLANFSGGNGLDIIFAGTSSTNCPITIVSSDGTLLRQTTIPSSIRTELAIIDLLNDGNLYIVFGDTSGNIWVKDNNLDDLDNFPINVGVRIESSPVFADMDGDGLREIIFGDGSGRLHILKSNGQYIQNYPLKISNAQLRRAPWVGNFDIGRGDIIVVVENGIDYIDTKLSAISPTWNTLRGNIGKTASINDPRTPIGEPNPTPFVNRLEQNYPNPFNPTTTISFDLAVDSIVSIEIFNIRGQKIRQLTNDFFEIGHHQVIWNGTDNFGNAVSSGMYFYRMTTDEFSAVKRMVLMK